MHPAFLRYWKLRHAAACGSSAYVGCGPGSSAHAFYSRYSRWHRDEGIRLAGRRGSDEDLIAGPAGFGVRRPLRFLASRLDLSDEQFARAAKILEELKIERAQAEVDLRRSGADFAQALEGGEFGREQVEAGRRRRVEAAARVQDAVARALEALHGLLDPEQREELATLIRSGALRL
jgi:Spy/CpxP family protein refolding chaperone